MAQARGDSPGPGKGAGGARGWQSGPPLPRTRAVPLPTDYIPLWVYGFITGVSILLVGSVILLVVCMTWRLPGKGAGLWGRIMGLAPLFLSFFPCPLLPTPLCEAVLRGHPAVPACPSQVKY